MRSKARWYHGSQQIGNCVKIFIYVKLVMPTPLFFLSFQFLFVCLQKNSFSTSIERVNLSVKFITSIK